MLKKIKILGIFIFILIFFIKYCVYAADNKSQNSSFLKYYIPEDVPPTVVEFVKAHTGNHTNDRTGVWFKYLTTWKGNLELYAYNYTYKQNTSKNELDFIGLPRIIVYDCHSPRNAFTHEVYDINYFLAKYLTTSKIKSEHLCHRDLEAFNQHNTPNPYRNKAKYYTPMYIPKAVRDYANLVFPTSWYPGANKRYIKYLTTYDDKYEVYVVYWSDTNVNSKNKYILYDCTNAREYQNNKERVDLFFLGSNGEHTSNKPTFCSSKNKLLPLSYNVIHKFWI